MEYENVTVLVVDDDPTIRKIHSGLLRRFGAVVYTAENGEEAVNLHHGGDSFDLVLMDKDMPEMDGHTATRELREMGVRSMIVGVTSRDRDDEKEAFMEAGADYCFGKPLNVDKVSCLLYQLKMNF